MYLLTVTKTRSSDDSIMVMTFRYKEYTDAYTAMKLLSRSESTLPMVLDIRDSNGDVRAIRSIAATVDEL